MDGGMGTVMFLSWRFRLVTVPVAEQVISGQSHGEDVVFQVWRAGGFPHCCLRSRRVVFSVGKNCEFTVEDRRMRRRMRVMCRGIFVICDLLGGVGGGLFCFPGKSAKVK